MHGQRHHRFQVKRVPPADDLQPLGCELMAEDIRWQQRFSNYRKALELLEDFLEPPALNEREQLGLIKAFEYT